MDTLPDRLRWILEHGTDPRGQRWSQRSLSLAAGLSQSHIGLIIRGDIASGALGVDTIASIARAAGVDFVWLATGNGQPGIGPAIPPNPEASRLEAAKLAREIGVSERAIAEVLAEPLEGHEGWHVLWWTDRMRRRDLELLPSAPAPPSRTAGFATLPPSEEREPPSKSGEMRVKAGPAKRAKKPG